MAAQNLTFLAFNRGLISRLGLARADVKRVALAAETMVNWQPRVLGSMMLRPGLQYTGNTKGNAKPYNVPFVFAIGDTADIELTNQVMRVWIDDDLVTRVAVTTAVTNGTFATDLTGWTDNDESGATSAWISAGLVGFTGTGTNRAIRDQQVSVTGNNTGVEHALRIVISRGPLTLRIGSTSGGDEYVSETDLGTGTHSLAFTPTGDFYIRFMSRLERIVHLAQCSVEAAGVMEIATPWEEADLPFVRYDQSGDVIFLADGSHQQRRIERRAAHSWSIVLYAPPDGPFLNENVSPTQMTLSAITGNVTITASVPYFKSTNVGGLFSVTSVGQTVTKNMALLNDATNSIRVTGIGNGRAISIDISGFTGGGRTIVLQRSFDDSAWSNVSGKSWTVDVNTSFDDDLDNQIVYYRLLLSVVGTAGTTVAQLSIPSGSIRGVARITGFTSTTVVAAEVLADFGGTTASSVWSEGQWSDRRGWPSSVGFYESRLFWAGGDKVNGSITGAFDGFDPDFEGDAGPISRSIGSGPVDSINWLLPMKRLLLGAEGTEFSCKSSSLDEPITPSNFNLKEASTQGSAPVGAGKVDARGIYVQRGGVRVFELAMDAETYDYNSNHLTALVPEIGLPRIVRMQVQRQPDTRVHFVRSDGTVAQLVFDKVENVLCWLEIETDGLIEDVLVLPGEQGEGEDHVYYFVKRTINGATVRFRERWAFEEDCRGDAAVCKLADAFVVFTNSPASATVGGLTHLIGESVVVFADGTALEAADGSVATFTVNGAGQITLTHRGEAFVATTGAVGLAYTAQWQSGKLVQLQAQFGTSLTEHKQIKGLGLIMADVHPKGLKYGKSFAAADLMDLPAVEDGAVIDRDDVREDYDHDAFSFPGSWNTDSRLCLQGEAPRPVTVLAAVCDTVMSK